MRIQYCSDLHLEFTANRDYLADHPLEPIGDILLLAGDIVNLDVLDRRAGFFDYISDHFKETYWIPGNHEYYHGDLAGRTDSFTERIRTNVTLLNNAVIEIGGVQLIFSTLWSAIHMHQAWRIEQGLNDFHQIRDGGKRFDVSRYNELHQQDLGFLTDVLAQPIEKTRIVVSHHLPTFRNYPAEYLNSYLNQAFASELDPLIETTQPDYWLFGHHHRNVGDFNIGRTQLLTNQLGYVAHREHIGFDPGRCLEIL